MTEGRSDAHRAPLVARSIGVASTTLAISAGAHAVGGGHVPAPELLAAFGMILVLAAFPLGRSRLHPRTLLPWTSAAQVVIHLTLAWLHPVAGTHVLVTGHHGADLIAAGGSAAQASSTMLLAHVLATVLTVALLTGADRSAAAAAAWWATLRILVTGQVRPARHATPVTPDATITFPITFLDDSVARRGPPALILA